MKKSILTIAIVSIVSIAFALTVKSFAKKVVIHKNLHNVVMIEPSAATQRITRTYSRINAIDASSVFKITYIQDNSKNYTEIDCPENLVEYLDIRMDNGKLKLNLENVNLKNNRDAGINVKVYSGFLEEVELSGASSFTSQKMNLQGRDLEFDLAGASRVDVSAISCEKIELDLSGASRINISDISCEEIDFDLSGASSADINTLKTVNVEIDNSGASDLNIDSLTADNVSVDVSGASKACLFGNARRVSYEASGSSTINASKLSASVGNIEASGASSIRCSVKSINSYEKSGCAKIKNK